MTTILLHKPEAGQSAEVAVRPGQTYQFAFDTDSVNFDSNAADVILMFEDGAVLHLKDFLRVTAHDDFIIAFHDGVQISAKDIADMFDMILEDFHTDGPTKADNAGAQAAQDGDGATLVAEAGLSALLGQEEFAPLCADVCAIPDQGHGIFGAEEYLITPHGESGGVAPPAGDRIGHASFSPGNAPGEPLQIKDLLDTGKPPFFESPHAPAFESLLDAPLTAPEQAARPSDCIVQTDGAAQDPFLLALFGLGPV